MWDAGLRNLTTCLRCLKSIVYHTCSRGNRSGNLAGQNSSFNCEVRHCRDRKLRCLVGEVIVYQLVVKNLGLSLMHSCFLQNISMETTYFYMNLHPMNNSSGRYYLHSTELPFAQHNFFYYLSNLTRSWNLCNIILIYLCVKGKIRLSRYYCKPKYMIAQKLVVRKFDIQ